MVSLQSNQSTKFTKCFLDMISYTSVVSFVSLLSNSYIKHLLITHVPFFKAIALLLTSVPSFHYFQITNSLVPRRL